MIRLRKINASDEEYFVKWWRDKLLLRVTSGELRRISNQEVNEYFSRILEDKKDKQYMITVNGKVIGHLALKQRRGGWYETQIVIGEKNQQNRGHGTKAIKQLLNKARKFCIKKIYLEVRPNNLRAIKVYEKCGFQKVEIKKYPRNRYLMQTLRMIIRTQE